MHPFLANTDERWFRHLRELASRTGGTLDEVNFWQPRARRPPALLAPGTPFFFRLKSPHNCIAGYGFHASFVVLRLDQAWDFFGERNGTASQIAFLERIGTYRRLDLVADASAPHEPLGCTLLRDAVFWPEERWIPWNDPEGWARNIVQGKGEKDPARIARLLAEIAADHRDAPPDLEERPFEPLEADERQVLLARNIRREGQGTFRARLLDAYGRSCAITGEHTEIVLDAAHIQPYLGPRSNHLQNGLLLTKELHTLFDRGYLTLTPDLRVLVSPRLHDEWQNGRRYYVHDGQPLTAVPPPPLRPSPQALEWHRERVFRG